jgi:hypothetical protein
MIFVRVFETTNALFNDRKDTVTAMSWTTTRRRHLHDCTPDVGLGTKTMVFYDHDELMHSEALAPDRPYPLS